VALDEVRDVEEIDLDARDPELAREAMGSRSSPTASY
jgi:hypothetical protein